MRVMHVGQRHGMCKRCRRWFWLLADVLVVVCVLAALAICAVLSLALAR